MANISSYNQLSSWNEDDDLLFVQQPDAPKKAHPSQMKEYILEGAINYIDVTVNATTMGHNPPTVSAGGAYYESLVTYEALGVARDKILNVIPVGWNNITKSFTIYLSTSVVGVFTDSDTSIYKDAIAVNTNLTLRVVYKNY